MRSKYTSMMEEEEILTIYRVWTEEDYQLSRRRIFLLCKSSSCAAEQFHSDVSLEAVEWRVPNNLKNWQWTREGDVSRWLLTPAPHSGKWPYSSQAVCWSTAKDVLVSASSICRHLLHHGLRARMPLYRLSLTVNHRWLCLQWAHEHRAWQVDWAPNCLFRWITLQFVGPW